MVHDVVSSENAKQLTQWLIWPFYVDQSAWLKQTTRKQDFTNTFKGADCLQIRPVP